MNSDASNTYLKVALVGGGPGGLAVLRMFESDIFHSLKAKVVGIADINPQAPALQYAKKKGIFVTNDYKEFYKIKDLNLIIELTGSDEVLYEIARTKPLHIQLMGHHTARLFWDVFQIEEERKKAIKELRQTNLFWQALFDCINDFIFVVDKRQQIVEANKAVLEKTRLTREAIKEKKCYELAEQFFSYKICEKMSCPLKQVWETAQPISQLVTLEDGRFIEISCYPLKANDHIERVVNIQRDVTDFVTCSVALEAAEKKFYSLFESATDGIIIVDENYLINEANLAAAEMLGYSLKELVNLPLQSIIPPEEKHFYVQFGTLAKGLLYVTGLKKNGQKLPLRVSIAKFRFKGKGFWTLILRDQTKRLELEEKLVESEKMAAIGKMASFLMHEIKNPLMIIGGFANQLLRQAEGKTKDKLRIIVKEVSRLEKLLGEVRDFSKPIKVEKQLLNVNAILKETAGLFTDMARKQKVTIEFDSHSEELLIKGDPELLKQVFVNLIKNALEAMPEGGKLQIRSFNEQDQVRIEIIDSGVGMKPEDLKEAFNPFFTTKKKGTGLGLPICYRIIKDHGGHIKLESQLGKGTKCIITLPIT